MTKLRLIQCGVGGHGSTWLKECSAHASEFDLVALVDISAAALEAAGASVGIASDRRFTSLEAALDAVGADAVLTVTPPAVHLTHARVAFARGVHLMTEKPMAETIADAREMVALAEASGRQLMVSQQRRFNAGIRTLRELVSTGAIGDFGHGRIDFYIPADFTGTFRETMDFPLLLDMAIHHLDLIRCVTGRDVTRVFAQSFRPSWSWYRHDPGLNLIMELDGGLPFSYGGDWTARGRSTGWNGTWRLQGSEGSLHLEGEHVYLARGERWPGKETVEEIGLQPPERPEYAESLHRFAEVIRRGGPPPENGGADNLRSLAVVLAAMRSAHKDRAVRIQEILASARED